MTTKVTAVILAAGRGTRMKSRSDCNKVALKIGSTPMIKLTVDHLMSLQINQIIAVVGFASESVKAVLGDKVAYAYQKTPLGTGDALKCALPMIDLDSDTILSMYGDDSAFYPSSLFNTLIQSHHSSKADITLLSLKVPDPTGLGRIIRDQGSQVISIVEEKNATEKQKQINEINTGLYCFNKAKLTKLIEQIQINPVSQEYYLTDVIQIAYRQHLVINSVLWPDSTVWHGINTPQQLQTAQSKLSRSYPH